MFCLSPFCYVCLRNKEELFNLNNIDGDSMRLWDKLLYCMSEIEDINVDIPLFICRECRCDLRVAYTFRTKFVTNFPYVDDYIRQLTYVDGVLLAEEDEVVAVEEVTEHADLCVTLVDFAKRFQHSNSSIKIETSDEDTNSVDDSYVEIQSEQNDVFSNCSDTENTPLSFLYKRENQSSELNENSNESFQQEKLRSNCETLINTIENPTKRRKLYDGEVILEDRASNSLDVKDDTSSLEVVDYNYNDLAGLSSDSGVQEEQPVILEMGTEVSTLLTTNEQHGYILVEENNLREESSKDINNGQSSTEEVASEPSIVDVVTASAANTQQQSTGESSKDEHRTVDLQVICDHIPVSSNKNTDENQKGTTSKQQLAALVHAGKGKLNQQANSITHVEVTQPTDSLTNSDIRPTDSITNALFESIRNSNRTCADIVADDDDRRSRPSVATSMYESDVIEDGVDEYISDNDERFGYRQPDTSVRGSCRREYSDISSPDSTADMNYESTTSVLHQAKSEVQQTGCGESSSTTLVHVKRPMSDVEDNYSNETVLYKDAVQTNTTDSVTSSARTSFSFMKAYLECTEVTTDVNTTHAEHRHSSSTEPSHSEQATTDTTRTSSTDECTKKKNQSISPSDASRDQTANSSMQGKCGSAECKKSVYTSIRKKIPRLIDLNGSIRKNLTSTFEHFTTRNNKQLLTGNELVSCPSSNSADVQQAIQEVPSGTPREVSHGLTTRSTSHHQLVSCQTSDSIDVQQAMHEVPSGTPGEVSHGLTMRSTSQTLGNNIPAYKCNVCDATFKYQSLLECHREEKHTRRQELLPEIIVQDVRNNTLASYRIPHLDKNKPVGSGEDRLDNSTRVIIESTQDTSQQKRTPVIENVTNKRKVGRKNSVDVATNTENQLCSKDKRSTSKCTQVLLRTQHSVTTARQHGTMQVDKTDGGSQLKPNAKGDKILVTKHNHQSENSPLENTNTQKKYRHLSANCQSKKTHNSTTSASPTMIDKATGTIDFTENRTGIYSFTDAIEENMYRIHADENKMNQKQHTDQHVNKVSTKVTSQVKTSDKPDIVHYYRTTEHLSSDKHGTKSWKKHQAKASTRSGQQVDKSTETNGLLVPRNPLGVNTVVTESVSSIGGSSKQLQANVTNNNNVGDKGETKCSLCDSTFADLNSLREHLIIEHKTYKKFQCTLCEKHFRQRCRLLYHMANTHANAQLYVCPVCEKNFSGAATLTRHMRCHCADKPYKCTVCDKAFRYKDSVRTHMVLHTGVKAYTCPYCARTFAFKGNMLQHVQTHTKEKRYPCPLCDKDFCTNTVMKQHMRTHTGERPYKCPTCARAFTVRQTMVKHMSVHTDVKPYPCTMCTARFKQKQHLRRHMYVHTDDKPYACTVCDKAFRLKTELDKHANVHDNTKQPYTCDICNVGYARRDKLYAHNFNIHYKKDINLVTISKDSTQI